MKGKESYIQQCHYWKGVKKRSFYGQATVRGAGGVLGLFHPRSTLFHQFRATRPASGPFWGPIMAVMVIPDQWNGSMHCIAPDVPWLDPTLFHNAPPIQSQETLLSPQNGHFGSFWALFGASDTLWWPFLTYEWLHYIALGVPWLAPPFSTLMAAKWPFWTLLNHLLEEKPPNAQKLYTLFENWEICIYLSSRWIASAKQNLYYFSHKIPILPVTGRELGEKGQNPQYWKTHTNIRKFRSGHWPERLTTLKQRKNGLGFYEIPFLPGTGRKVPKNAWLLTAPFFLSFLMRK